MKQSKHTKKEDDSISTLTKINYIDNNIPNDDEISTSTKSYQLNNILIDKIHKYIYSDDLIRKKKQEHKDEIEQLIKIKKEIEPELIKLLLQRAQDDRCVPITPEISDNCGEINVKELLHKGKINPTIVKNVFLNKCQEHKLIKDDHKRDLFLEEILASIDVQLPKKTKFTLSRKIKKQKKNIKNMKNINNIDDIDIPIIKKL